MSLLTILMFFPTSAQIQVPSRILLDTEIDAAASRSC